MAKAKDEQKISLRFRRTISLPGSDGQVLHQANSKAMVDNTDEAWDAVNRGDADLDPPAGQEGQPIKPEDIPDKLTKAPIPPGTPTIAGPVTAKAGQPAATEAGTDKAKK